jgi:Ca2+-binding EF-hand superfamily protein
MSYPNLSEAMVQRSTTFFSQTDTNNDGLVSLKEINDVCYAHAAQHPSYAPPQPPFVPTILTTENKTSEDTFSQAEYEALQVTYPSLTDAFNTIDTNSTGSILGSDLVAHYEPQPEVIITAISQFWLEHIKEEENLTDESTITLEQFLTLQNTYNMTRYFPLADE